MNVFCRELEAQFYDPRDPYGNKAEWRPLIGRGPSRYCALIGWDPGVAMSALWSHRVKAQGTQSLLLDKIFPFGMELGWIFQL